MALLPSSAPRSIWPRWDENRLFTVLLAIVFAYASVWMLMTIRLKDKEFGAVGRAPEVKNTITIEGTGKVSSVPTIARISTGVLTQGGTDVSSLQKQNTEKMNAMLAAFAGLGIPKADLQTTNYTIQPRYDYTDGKTTLVGYQVSQDVTVTVRDLSKVSSVFQKAGELGANQVNGPDFTIDEPETLKVEARAKAIENAQVKADTLARSLGVTLTKVVSFSESAGGYPPPMYKAYDMRAGVGGAESAAPAIEAGSLDVVANVSISYEIE